MLLPGPPGRQLRALRRCCALPPSVLRPDLRLTTFIAASRVDGSGYRSVGEGGRIDPVVRIDAPFEDQLGRRAPGPASRGRACRQPQVPKDLRGDIGILDR